MPDVDERWRPAVIVEVNGKGFPLSLDEAREIIDKLRQPDTGNPLLADAQLAAAVFLERLVEELNVANPPLRVREARSIGLAITRLEISAGISLRQLRLRSALLAWDVAQSSED